jgi:hypothetical protein
MPTYVSHGLRNDVTQISIELLKIIDEAFEKFKLIPEKEWSARPSPEQWSKKEVIGHLIDSAANNHIRFVRAQLAQNEFVGLSYEQSFFVSAQQYQQRGHTELIELWLAYNRHLAHVIRHIDSTKFNVLCKIGQNEPVTLLFVVEDYIGHIKHHLKQIIG